MRAMYTLVFIFIGSESIAAIIGAWALFGLRANLFARFTGILLTGMAIDQACQLMSNFDRPRGVHYSSWFISWWIVGRVIRSATLWALVLNFFKIRTNGHSSGASA